MEEYNCLCRCYVLNSEESVPVVQFACQTIKCWMKYGPGDGESEIFSSNVETVISSIISLDSEAFSDLKRFMFMEMVKNGIRSTEKLRKIVDELNETVRMACDRFHKFRLNVFYTQNLDYIVDENWLDNQSNEEMVIHDKAESCAVCLEDLLSEEVSNLPCLHVFHRNCVLKWIKRSNSCPICRFVFTKDCVN